MSVLLLTLQNDMDPIGLRYIHNYLLKHSIHSNILYLPGFQEDSDDHEIHEIRMFVEWISPQLLGLSIMSNEYFKAVHLTKHLKRFFPDIPILWGGIHPTIAPEMCLKYADFVCIGEGESTVLDMIYAVQENKSLKTISNLSFLENGEMKKNPLYPLLHDPDGIPPDSNIPENSFVQHNGRILTLEKRIFNKYARFSGTITSVMSSRGCPFSCTYCCNSTFGELYGTNKVRRRSISNVIQELETAKRRFPDIRCFNFLDDCFLACNEKYLYDFFEVYKERVNVPFIVRCIPTYLTDGKMKILKEYGLAWLNLGLQSGSDRTNKEIYKRKSLNKHFLKAAGLVKKYNVAAFYDVILDNPFETDDDRLNTVMTLIETPKPFYPSFFSLTFYMGTQIYDRAIRELPGYTEEFLTKDYQAYKNTMLNNMARLATFLNAGLMKRIVAMYESNPEALWFKLVIFIARIVSLCVLEPLTYLRVLKLAQGGNYIRLAMVFPHYIRDGFRLFIKRFKSLSFSDRKSSGLI